MRPALPLFAAVFALLLPPLATHSQNAPPAAPATPPKTLAQALAEAETPKSEVFLTVGAEYITPPKDAAPLRPGDPVPQVAEAYGQITEIFETVAAVAPPTMTVLNTDPGTPNPYDGMPPADVLKLMLAGLSDAQWKELTGAAGVGLSDLTSEAQQEQFAALFPADSLILHPYHQDWGGFSGENSALPKLTQSDLQQARLQLGKVVQLGIPVVGKQEWTDVPTQQAESVKYDIYSGDNSENARDTLYGVKVRDVVPNVPKLSDLDFDTDALRKNIPLDGVKTVADLIARIGAATKLELYADRRYEKRSVTVLGPSSARVKDLLQALALCVTGTYRKVGPAYVLTDDLLGAGTRRMILVHFAQEAEMARHGALTDAGDRLITAHGNADNLPLLANSLAISDAQKAQAAKDNQFLMPGQGMQVQVPLGQLTLAQQDAARRFSQQWNATTGKDVANQTVTLNGKLLLMAQPTYLLQVPSLDGSVSLDNYFGGLNLFQPSSKLQEQFLQEIQKQQPANPPPAVSHPSPALGPLLAAVPRRIVFARPRTAQDVDALVLSMRRTGMNALWLDVFSGGSAHVPADSLPQDNLKQGQTDILTEALAKTKGTGIAVFPALDLLRWGPSAPEDARDLTMLGQTSPEAEAWQQRYEAVMDQDQSLEEAQNQPAPTDVAVSPIAPSVQGPLLALVQKLAAMPGIAGLILRETAPLGYDRTPNSGYTDNEPFGYTPLLRLAFLRHDHVDPVDLEKETYVGQMNADTSLPEFDDSGVEETEEGNWNTFRAAADRGFMQKLLVAAQGAGQRPEVWVKQRRSSYQGDWYGLWDNPRAPLPDLSEELAMPSLNPGAGLAAFAHTQSRQAVLELPSWAATSGRVLANQLHNLKPGWDGIVLDLSQETSGNPLADLEKSLTPSKAPVKP